MNNGCRVTFVVLLGLACGCGRKPEGVAEIRIPEQGLHSLARVSLKEMGAHSATWSVSNLTEVVSARLPVGEYRVLLGFANSNYQPPTEVEAGHMAVTAAMTNVFSLGLLAFNVREDIPDLNLSAVMVRGSAGGPEVALRNTGNTYYFFLPKPLPPGLYDAAILYNRSTGPSMMTTGIVVRAGETTVVEWDSGLVLRPPTTGTVTGWSLTPEGRQESWLAVRRGLDNDEPLWRRFMVPPGRYRLDLVRDPASPPATPEIVTVEAGRTRVHPLAP